MQLRMKPIKKKENTGYAVWTCSLLPWIKPCLQPTFGLTWLYKPMGLFFLPKQTHLGLCYRKLPSSGNGFLPSFLSEQRRWDVLSLHAAEFTSCEWTIPSLLRNIHLCNYHHQTEILLGKLCWSISLMVSPPALAHRWPVFSSDSCLFWIVPWCISCV